MRIMRALYLPILPLLASCSSLATDCLSMAPPGTWTKIETPSQNVVALFEAPATGSSVLWFKNRDGKFAMCQSCAASSEKAMSFQMAEEKIETLVDQVCLP
jgi:hypothetical protein